MVGTDPFSDESSSLQFTLNDLANGDSHSLHSTGLFPITIITLYYSNDCSICLAYSGIVANANRFNNYWNSHTWNTNHVLPANATLLFNESLVLPFSAIGGYSLSYNDMGLCIPLLFWKRCSLERSLL